MTNPEPSTTEQLLATIRAQEKTITVLMDTVEQLSAEGKPSLALLSQNLNLERVVQRKTENLRQQGEMLRQALDELQRTQAQLLQANKLESVGRLAAGIAHEINTPSQFIGSNIEFLSESFHNVARLIDTLCQQITQECGGVTPDPLQDALDSVDWEFLRQEIPVAISQSQDGIKRISSIVSAMKEFSHPSGKEKISCDLNKLIETTVIVTRNEWKYNSEVHTDLAVGLPMVQGLADELCQVFLNMLVNAAHAIETATNEEMLAGKGAIYITTRRDGNWVEVQIADTGCGIPEAIQNRIFDPFFTTKEVGKGTGQGLAIAHDVITKKHNGTITLASTPGKGSTFIVRLPVDP